MVNNCSNDVHVGVRSTVQIENIVPVVIHQIRTLKTHITWLQDHTSWKMTSEGTTPGHLGQYLWLPIICMSAVLLLGRQYFLRCASM